MNRSEELDKRQGIEDVVLYVRAACGDMVAHEEITKYERWDMYANCRAEEKILVNKAALLGKGA
jgi:hypothetical protein